MEVCDEFGKLHVVWGLGSWKKLERDWEENLGPDHQRNFGFYSANKGRRPLDVLNWELLKSFNKITVRPR